MCKLNLNQSENFGRVKLLINYMNRIELIEIFSLSPLIMIRYIAVRIKAHNFVISYVVSSIGL